MAERRLSLADQAFVNALAMVVAPVLRDKAALDEASGMVRAALALGADTDAPVLAGLGNAWDGFEAARQSGDVPARARAEMVLREELAAFFRWRAMMALERAEAARKGAA